MSSITYLHQLLLNELGRKQIETKTPLPDSIVGNLSARFAIRPYQKGAFQYFLNYWNEDWTNKPTENHHLLFLMATGSGKTMIMAGLIAYLYEQGYRNFLFFVNSDNVIKKTRDNFLNPASPKYLFANSIYIGDRQVRIKEVSNFQAANPDDINLVFSTIQGLHSRLNTPRENSLTYDDFSNTKIALLSDEAHHINAETKKGIRDGIALTLDADMGFEKLDVEQKEVVSWEHTVMRLFKAHPDNLLLEFTATMDLGNPDVAKKYINKLLYDYPLKKFREDGYSKEIKVLQSDLSKFERALQAVLLSQYRRKIFEKHKKIVKPVILFKSKTINESKAFYNEFVDGMKYLSAAQLAHIKSLNDYNTETYQTLYEKGGNVSLAHLFRYLDDNGISLENFIIELKEDFSTDKLLVVNSKDDSELKQIAVNNLEDPNNEYRIIFAVDKLNEGWDVLNLFDIVRLYNTRDANKGKPGKSTMSEAQLIGRGARYYPHQITNEQPVDQRKYDDDVRNELRICEELHYHTEHNPRYIQELNTALIDIGIKAFNIQERELKLKESFKKSDLYQKGFIFLNEPIPYDTVDIVALPSIPTIEVRLKTGYSQSSVVFDGAALSKDLDIATKEYVLSEWGDTIIRKAINKSEFYRFDNLQKQLPNLGSISTFIHSPDYLGKVRVSVKGLASQIRELSPQQKLDVAIEVLKNLIPYITSNKRKSKGNTNFSQHELKKVFDNKMIQFDPDKMASGDDRGKSMQDSKYGEYLNLASYDWYAFNDCYGSSEEKKFVLFIKNAIETLRQEYEEVFLLRNERHFKLYDFEEGRAFEPDFVLFLAKKRMSKHQYYQVFIEPKGEHLLANDRWKEFFLLQLKEQYCIEKIFANREYILWGMPFFCANNAEQDKTFRHEFDILKAAQ